ncbi:hypothetical protein EYF80_010913 [Liparis tanakae]|uniref:Uncharacterized protein n=1 Tax=Liparis tanakae TaxID=230148 RepID=A0A4Z2INJ4_9TELE|nr:hypothetical protein EYF80_010913 [Liparis tanakae]
MAGMILPAIRLVLSRSAGSMAYIRALRADAAVTKSMWPLPSSSFSNCSGLTCSLSARQTQRQRHEWLEGAPRYSLGFVAGCSPWLSTCGDVVGRDGLLQLCDGLPLFLAAQGQLHGIGLPRRLVVPMVPESRRAL